MRNRRLHAFLAAAAATAMGAGLVVSTVPAAAATPATLSIKGDLEIAPNVHLLRIDAMGARDKDGMTDGTYTATVLTGMNPTPIQVKGPVTCIYVKGKTASLVYPISDIRPIGLPTGLKDVAAVQITVRQNVEGTTDKVGVVGPLPTDSFKGCDPAATPFTFTGTVTTTGG